MRYGPPTTFAATSSAFVPSASSGGIGTFCQRSMFALDILGDGVTQPSALEHTWKEHVAKSGDQDEYVVPASRCAARGQSLGLRELWTLNHGRRRVDRP